MSNLARFNPFRRTMQVEPSLWADRFFDQHSWPFSLAGQDQPRMINVDIADKGNNYLVEAEIPGVKKEDISISIDGNQVSITAEIKRESEKKEEGSYLCNERYYGRSSRSFLLDHAVDENHVKAQYADGILKIELPKKENSASKKITIS
jgi:HSP20 family protein